MPKAEVIGPEGQVRPADTRANASLMARIATGEAKETIRKPAKPACKKT